MIWIFALIALGFILWMLTGVPRPALDHPETCWCGGRGELLNTYTGDLYPCDGYQPPIPGVPLTGEYRGPDKSSSKEQ